MPVSISYRLDHTFYAEIREYGNRDGSDSQELSKILHLFQDWSRSEYIVRYKLAATRRPFTPSKVINDGS